MSFRRIIKLLYGSMTFSAKANSQQPTADIGPFSYFCVIIVKQRKMQAKQFWTKAYQRNIAKMVGVCCRYVGDRAVAEDLAHEAFLKAIEKSGTYRRLATAISVDGRQYRGDAIYRVRIRRCRDVPWCVSTGRTR